LECTEEHIFLFHHGDTEGTEEQLKSIIQDLKTLF
jgi:hypothetical protein